MRIKTAILALALFTAAVLNAGALTFKLASLLPEGTEWNSALQEMGADWREVSDGRIRVRIYPGGIAGGESDVIRKMRIGQIDMAVLSSIGMTAILPDTFAMSMPFMLKNEAELDFIVDEVTPIFDDDILDKGFVVLAWSKSGWVSLFSKRKAIEPQEMMQMKFVGSVTQPELAEAFKRMGFNIVSVDTPDVLMGLQSGMVEALYAPAMVAASYQWFGIAGNMLDIKVSPVLGGIVISERAWRRVPDRYKEDLIAAAQNMAGKFYRESVSLEKQAMTVMKNNGLIIHEPEPRTVQNWRNLLGDDFSVLVGDDGFVSEESFNQVYSMLEEFRSR